MVFRVFLLLIVVQISQNVEVNWSGKQRKSRHPFLYFTSDDIEVLRLRSKTTHSDIAKKITEAVNVIKSHGRKFLPPRDWNVFSSRWNERYGNDLSALAIYVVLNGHDLQARDLALEYMDIMSGLSNWRVRATLIDDVPVAHSLAGLAIAYDFLYGYLNQSQRTRYLSKIKDVSRELYEKSLDVSVWWGKSYIQNHCATNYAALLIGALVVSQHNYKEAGAWVQRAHQMLNRTIFLLNFVVDGSMNEGVAYGSYTSRSLTQYVYLALRHFKIDLTQGPWLREHFWFIYHTILPGFQRTVGIADSNNNWFYGPESQLMFLDNYVLKNGWGNWLARKIRENKLRNRGYIQSPSQYNCMLHMEFLFYNASIGERPPFNYDKPQIHVFSDWGVVTYGGAQALPGAAMRQNGVRGTFLSFKCSRLHGRSVNTMVRRKWVKWLRGWKSFNPGHEHPDQGSFVFAPNGLPFIADTLYAPKYTWLNNALVFGPSAASRCFAPNSGQLGECQKWFNYKNAYVWKAEGEIIASSNERGTVFMSGEMSKWYNSSMGLVSVYRSLVLLKPAVLLVLDHIERKRSSPLKYMSAFFHNTASSFHIDSHPLEQDGFKVILNGSVHRITWSNTYRSHKSTAVTGESGHGKQNSSFVNITTPFPKGAQFGRVAYLLTGPGEHIQQFQVKGARDKGVHVAVTVNGVEYQVSIVTKHRSPQTRYQFLGFGGFARVDTKKYVVRFGLGTVKQWNKTAFHKRTTPQFLPRTNELVYPSFIVLSICTLFTAVCLYTQFIRRIRLRPHWKKILFSLILCSCFLSMILPYYTKICNDSTCPGTSSRVPTLPVKPKRAETSGVPAHKQQPPFVMYTSLPFAGGELVDFLFKDSNDFFWYHLLTVQFDGNPARRSVFLDPCKLYQVRPPRKKESKISRFLLKLMESPQLLLGNSFPKRLQNALPAVRLEDPGWALRLQWLRKTLNQRVRLVIVVRDPRGWVQSWLKVLKNDPRRLRVVKSAFDKLKQQQCGRTEPDHLASDFRDFQSVLLETEQGLDVELHTIFAHLWSTYINAVLRITKKIPKKFIRIVRFEDYLQKPRRTAARVYQFIGIPLPAAVEHRVQQVVRTGQFSIKSSGELINSRTTVAWKGTLTTKQIADIERICGKGMAKFQYASKNIHE